MTCKLFLNKKTKARSVRVGKMRGKGTWGLMLGGTFDPVMTVLQIVCMQAVFYVGMGATLFVVDAVTWQSRATTAQLFSATSLSSSPLSEHSWWATVLSYTINGVITSFAMVHVVGKARKAADFAFTAVIIHCVVSLAYDARLQAWASWEWWLSMLLVASATTLLSETLCMRHELTDIPVGLFSSSDLTLSRSLTRPFQTVV